MDDDPKSDPLPIENPLGRSRSLNVPRSEVEPSSPPLSSSPADLTGVDDAPPEYFWVEALAEVVILRQQLLPR